MESGGEKKEEHMVFECSALRGVRKQYAPLFSSGMYNAANPLAR